jgi:hypothetical protein
MRLRYLNGVRGSLDVMIGIRNTELVFTSLFNSIDDFHVMEPNFLVNFGSTRSVHSYCNRITVVYNSYLELSYLYHSNEEVKYRAQAVKRTWHRVHVYFEVIVSSSNALRESRSNTITFLVCLSCQSISSSSGSAGSFAGNPGPGQSGDTDFGLRNLKTGIGLDIPEDLGRIFPWIKNILVWYLLLL